MTNKNSNLQKSVSDYFLNNVVNETSFSLSVQLEKIQVLSGILLNIQSSDSEEVPLLSRKSVQVECLAEVIGEIAGNARKQIQSDNINHLQKLSNVYELGREVVNG